MNLIGAAVQRLAGIVWVADQRDSVLANAAPPLRSEGGAGEGEGAERVVRLVAEQRRRVVTVSEFIADEVRGFDPKGPVA